MRVMIMMEMNGCMGNFGVKKKFLPESFILHKFL
jgi:hypothetical protein